MRGFLPPMDQQSAEALNKAAVALNKENKELRQNMLHLQVRLHAAEKKQQEYKELRQLVRQLQVRLYVAETKQQQTLEDMKHLKSVQEQEILRFLEDMKSLKIAHEEEVARINARNEKLLAEAIEMNYPTGRRQSPHTGTVADGDTGSSSDPVGMIQVLPEEESDSFSHGGLSGSMPSPGVQKAMLEDPTMASPEPVTNLNGTPSLVHAQLSPVVGSSRPPSETDSSETRRCTKDCESLTGVEDRSPAEMDVDARDDKSFGASTSSATPGTGSSDDVLSGAILEKISLELSNVSQQSKAKELLSEYFGMTFDTLHQAIQHLEASRLAEAQLKALYHKFTRHFNLPGQLIVPSLRLCEESLHPEE